MKLTIHRKLGFLYKDGIPEKYDYNGNKISGVEPNPNKAIYHFTTAKNMGSIECGIELAKLYHYGMHKLEPQLDSAQSLYDDL